MRQRLIMTAAVLVLLGVMPMTGTEQDTTIGRGLQLIEQCDDDMTEVAGYASGYCDGLVHGVQLMLDTYESPGGALDLRRDNYTPRFCPPVSSTPTSGHYVRVVQKHLEDHPTELRQPDTALVIAALREAFPCAD